ncbi:hypothetical protein BGZ61DRAFT_195555 [Ilyonectria robusta]|uniref:uncharacterized protein n=1 Tax=Ilyonectria robusta TaxID=1079257 RepID=UPI001E8EBCB9|nr:uncharacterized protein BGZ61DRAFT_195555 [Ilyonectria robusta]KAH8721832.1 hypothetical protein BGZ61DRAFT_195555 [Ilyonectria robusta]
MDLPRVAVPHRPDLTCSLFPVLVPTHRRHRAHVARMRCCNWTPECGIHVPDQRPQRNPSSRDVGFLIHESWANISSRASPNSHYRRPIHKSPLVSYSIPNPESSLSLSSPKPQVARLRPLRIHSSCRRAPMREMLAGLISKLPPDQPAPAHVSSRQPVLTATQMRGPKPTAARPR